MKVLIISHNPISNQSNMGKTFLSLFSGFAPQELCQLYIYPTIPNEKRCNSYYRITDKQVLRSLMKFQRPGGRILPEQIREEHTAFEESGDESLYRSRKNKSALRRLLRDTMWCMSRWYGPELKAWLAEEKPDCIFVAPGVAKFIHNFALKISGDLNIPVVTYVCDEYYFVKRPDTALDRLRLSLLKGKIDALMAQTSHLVVISEEFKADYSEKFGVDTTTLMTGSAFQIAEETSVPENPTAISYFGNVRCNRYVSLGEIGQTLDEINRELGTDYRLNIYTAEKNQEILEQLQKHTSIKLCGFVAGEAFQEALRQSQLLLHTEAFDEDSIDFVRHSVSTKIADSLASGIPLVAYGPECISSMKHLLRHGCAISAVSREELRSALITAFTDGAARKNAAEKGLSAARSYHDSQVTGQRMKQIMESVTEKQ